MFGCVRLGRLSYSAELRAKFVWAERLHWLALDPSSSERHIFAGGPRLETVEFEKMLEPWAENMVAGATEFEVCGRPESRQGVGWPASLILPPEGAFKHIGSVKADKELAGVAV